MSLISTLPVIEGAKIIVIDEGAEVNYAESLITAWLPIWKLKDGRDVHLLLFSGPKNSSKIRQNSLEENQLKVHDFYSLGLEETEPLNHDDVKKKLWEIPELNNFHRNSTVIIDSLSSLLFYKSVKEICKFIDKLSQKITQLVCIYQRDFTPKKIPSVNTLGTSYVRLEKTRGLKLEQNLLTYKSLTYHSKPGGGILQQIETVEQNMNNYEIRIGKMTTREARNSSSASKKTETNNTDNKIQASFRIEINDREMEQRKATPLPYTLNTNASPLSESKIHYEPDEIDDLDEEDPDDDLDF